MLLPGLFHNNNYPGEYAHLAQDSEAILNDRAYDSFNVVTQQSLTPSTSLTTMLTTSHRGPPKLSEAINVAGRNYSVRASIDSQGVLSGSCSTSLLHGTRYQSAARLRLLGDVRPLETEKSKKLMATGRAELHVEGGDYSLTALYSLPGNIAAGTYLQGIGDKVAVGCELVRPPQIGHPAKVNASPSIMGAAGIRYTNINKDHNSDPGVIVTLQANTEKTASASVLAQLPGDFAIAASANADFCNVSSRPREEASTHRPASSSIISSLKKTRLSISAGFTKLHKNSQVSVNCNTYGEMCCNVRHAMKDGTVAEVIGSADLFSGRTTVGVGLVLPEGTLPRFARRVMKQSGALFNHQ